MGSADRVTPGPRRFRRSELVMLLSDDAIGPREDATPAKGSATNWRRKDQLAISSS
jgi:hypothetical protein